MQARKRLKMLMLGVALLLLFLFFSHKKLDLKGENQEKRAKPNAAKTSTQVSKQRGEAMRLTASIILKVNVVLLLLFFFL